MYNPTAVCPVANGEFVPTIIVSAASEYQVNEVPTPTAVKSGTGDPKHVLTFEAIGNVLNALIVKVTLVAALSQPFELVSVT